MNSSPELTALVSKLAYKERSWRWLRWLQLGVGLAMLGSGAKLVAYEVNLHREALMSGIPASSETLYIACIVALIVFGGWQVMHAIANWHGDHTAKAVIELHRVVEGAQSLPQAAQQIGEGGLPGSSSR